MALIVDEADKTIAQGRLARREGTSIKKPPADLDAFLVRYWTIGWAREHDEIAAARGAAASGER